MIFVPAIINNTLPQVSVTIADSGNPAVTYAQVKNSLGNQVYKIDAFYLFSTSFNQLIGAIQYQRYDVSGNQDYKSITTTVDPYQFSNAIEVDLTKYETSFILNGNSTLSAIILPNTFLQIKLYCRRVTNSFGNMTNFKDIEEIFRPRFYTKYIGFETNGKLDILNKTLPFDGNNNATDNTNDVLKKEQHDNTLAVLSFAAFSVGLYLFVKK